MKPSERRRREDRLEALSYAYQVMDAAQLNYTGLDDRESAAVSKLLGKMAQVYFERLDRYRVKCRDLGMQVPE